MVPEPLVNKNWAASIVNLDILCLLRVSLVAQNDIASEQQDWADYYRTILRSMMDGWI
jgi:hypothetical protein